MRFQDTLDKTVSDFKRPPNLPQGDYVFQVIKAHDLLTRSDDRYEVLSIPCRPIEPLASVDTDALETFGTLESVTISKEFMLDTEGNETDAARFQFNIRQFLENCGVDSEMSLKQALAAVVGAKFLGQVTWQPNKNDPEQMFVRLGRTAKYE
jgi:hypothetical protein